MSFSLKKKYIGFHAQGFIFRTCKKNNNNNKKINLDTHFDVYLLIVLEALVNHVVDRSTSL